MKKQIKKKLVPMLIKDLMISQLFFIALAGSIDIGILLDWRAWIPTFLTALVLSIIAIAFIYRSED
jgi:hypothetical protein